MAIPEAFKPIQAKGFDIKLVSHAGAILAGDFPSAMDELADVLGAIEIPIEELIGSGGGETKGTQRLRRALASKGWKKQKFLFEKRINGIPREATSHEVDHVRTIRAVDGSSGALALEIEWNNKDPFFDRDLENFKRLHAEGAISVGLVVTRGASMQASIRDFVLRWANENAVTSFVDLAKLGVLPTTRQREAILKQVDRLRSPRSFVEAWTDKFVSDKFGAATTHWSKLIDRIDRGVGSPCPLVLIGIPSTMITFGEDKAIVSQLLAEGAVDNEVE